VVDLTTMKSIIWNDEDMGMTYKEEDVPAELLDEATEWRNHLIESVAETNDELMEKFFEDPESITVAEMRAAIRAATIDMSIIPMMCGSAFKNKGVQFMLDGVCTFLPAPVDVEAIIGTNPNTDEEESRKPNADEPFSALAFKITTDPFVGRLAYFRVYSGTLDAGSYILNTRSGKKERISRIYEMHANDRKALDKVQAGDIAAAVGMKDLKTGDTLSSLDNPIVLESMTFPEPVISVAIEPKTTKDLDKMGIAIAKLVEEDPTLRVRTDENTGQTVLSGMGELHLD
ncbi:MAG: EF-Tu/IF-2/RF-3 family GTPase, partial [Flavobacteriales bacterium]